MKTHKSALATLLFSFALLLTTIVHASLPGMKLTKLYSRGQANYTNRQFGAAVAINETYAVVGEPAFNPNTPAAGAVHVFNAVTGAYIRQLKPLPSAVNDGFGSSLALNGKLLLVGADGHNNAKGGCYLFDLSTGKQLKQFTAAILGDGFGRAVAMSDTHLYMGAPLANNTRGNVRVEGINSTFSATLSDPTANSGQQFGSSIYVYGDRVAIGAPGYQRIFLFKGTTPDGFTTTAGEGLGKVLVGSGLDVYASAPGHDFFGMNTGSVQTLSIPNDVVTTGAAGIETSDNQLIGELLAVDGEMMVCSYRSIGGLTLSVNSLASTSVLMEIPPSDLGSAVEPTAIALAGGRLLVGSAEDAVLGMDAGAAYLIQSLPQPAGFHTVVTKGEAAPGAAGISHNTLGDATFSFVGRHILRSTLSGPGSNGGKDSGIYAENGFNFLESVAKSRESWFGSALFNTLGSPISNDSTFTLFPATLAGPGITPANNAVLLADNGTLTYTIARTGTPLVGAAGTAISALRQAAQSRTASRVAIRIDAKIGPGGTTAADDTAISLQTHLGVPTEQIRENLALGGGVQLGQIAPRVAFHSDVYWYSASLRGTGITAANGNALYRKAPGASAVRVAAKGDNIPNSTTTKYSSFIGEGGSLANPCLRAMVTTGATTNEAILFDTGTGLGIVARQNTGDIVRILRAWPMGNRILLHTVIRGTGITPANNEVLDLYQEDGTRSRMLQKGSLLPNTGGLRVAAIQRVEVSPDSRNYAVLIALGGAPSTSNQMLLKGDVTLGMPSDFDSLSLRLPLPLLRKGQTFAEGYASSTRLTSLAFANASTMDATGVGHKGLATVVSNAGHIVLRATFSDGSTRLISVF